MGINTADGLPLRITFSFLLPFFFIHFFYCGKMNLAISLGLILSAVVVTARIVKPGGETNNYVDKAAAIPEEGDEEIVQTAVAEKKEIKAEMADEDKKGEAEFEEVIDAKPNKVVLRQKINCIGCHSICKAKAPDCQSEQACMQACIQRIGKQAHKQACMEWQANKSLDC